MIELAAQLAESFCVIDRIEPRPVACSECNALPECIGNDQNVRKQDCSIESESANRLQCNFRCQFRIKTKIEKITDLLSDCAIFRQIPSGLPHQPDWRDSLSPAGKNIHYGFGHRSTRDTAIFNTNRILESVVVLGQLIGLISRLAHRAAGLPTYPRLSGV